MNQKESDQSRTARIREIMRWSVLTILIGLLFGGNVFIWYIGMNYNNLLNSKERDIKQIKHEISMLLEKGKNLSKQDIMTLARLENNRFMWAECFQRLGNMTPDDMSITGLKFKRNKLLIKGIASTYKGKKEFEQIDQHCKKRKIQWFVSSWDIDSQISMRRFKTKFNKVASAMLVHEKLLEIIAEEGKPTFISTGMSTMKEIEKAVKIFRKYITAIN